MYAEVAWVLVSLGTQVQPQVILDPDYLPDYLSVSYDYDLWRFQSARFLTLIELSNFPSDTKVIKKQAQYCPCKKNYSQRL